MGESKWGWEKVRANSIKIAQRSEEEVAKSVDAIETSKKVTDEVDAALAGVASLEDGINDDKPALNCILEALGLKDQAGKEKFASLPEQLKTDIKRSASNAFSVFQEYRIPKPEDDITGSYSVVYNLSHRLYHRSTFWGFDGPFKESKNFDAFRGFFSGFSAYERRKYYYPIRRYEVDEEQGKAVAIATRNALESAGIPKKTTG